MLPSLIVLHGSNGSGETMRPVVDLLTPYAVVEAPNLLGHGGRSIPERFSIEDMARDVVAYLDKRSIQRAFFFGYSTGGYIAWYLARHAPERLRGVCTLATKFVFDEATVAYLSYLADPERLSRPGNPRAAQLTATHAPQNWVTITNNNIRLFREIGEKPPLTDDDLRAILVPALVASSYDDQILPWREALQVAELLRARVRMYRGVLHPLSSVPIDALAQDIGEWIGDVVAAETTA